MPTFSVWSSVLCLPRKFISEYIKDLLAENNYVRDLIYSRRSGDQAATTATTATQATVAEVAAAVAAVVARVAVWAEVKYLWACVSGWAVGFLG